MSERGYIMYTCDSPGCRREEAALQKNGSSTELPPFWMWVTANVAAKPPEDGTRDGHLCPDCAAKVLPLLPPWRPQGRR